MLDVILHFGKFRFVQPTGFEEDFVANTNFTYIMKKGSLNQALNLAVSQLDAFGKADRIQGDSEVMDIGIAIAFGDGAG